MEWTTNDLLDRYRCADFIKRLHLYLQYPDLRDDFIKMDREDLDANLCYVPGTRRRNPSRKKKIGILLVTIGLIWLGARVGLLDFSWLQLVHFGPGVFILLGVWMVSKGFMREIPRTIAYKTKEV